MMAPATSMVGRVCVIMARERATRFSGGLLGPMWAYITPLAWIGFITILFHALSRTPPIHVDPEIFVATGVLPYIAFRQTVTSMSRSIISHRYLQYIRPVSPNEILFATAGTEALNFLVSALLTFGLITLAFQTSFPANLSGVLCGLALAWALSVSLGRLVAVIGILSDSFARVVPILLRPLFWISGVFYTATELPTSLQNILWYSPLFHVSEIIREGYFLGYVSPISSFWYPLAIAASLYLLSIPIERYVVQTKRGRYRI